ncbi:type III secretion system needle filament subunit SctF [Shewanella surugensis]|uniref:Type III secretion system needle filament subunit SctF n=1 Tax=Shewanella surugensis TaxID=212020 RepID=A0ABT0L7Q4_9GAMM|nr:type III secretion system needle filament subunit SctF [Shewanella surugensis]MCL1123673.1 type III secretion system needle filament subunit SctF [Shewanella surugensis]
MDLSAIVSQISQQSASAAADLESVMATTDANDPDAMLQMQFSMQQYSNLVGYESAIIKTIKDMIQGIIAKI